MADRAKESNMMPFFAFFLAGGGGKGEGTKTTVLLMRGIF